jgi:hypothetical protein
MNGYLKRILLKNNLTWEATITLQDYHHPTGVSGISSAQREGNNARNCSG